MILLVMPFKDWPTKDKNAWAQAIREGDVLDGQGPATHWRPATMKSAIEHYGRWLSYLSRHGDLDTTASPESRITKDRVRGHIDELRARVAPRTVVSSLVGLKVTIMAMAPDQSWRWLMDVCNRLNVQSKPSKDKRLKMRSTNEIIAHAIQELDRLSATALSLRIERVAFRDTLMIGLIAMRPLRLKNFTGLILGKTLLHEGDRWRINIEGEDTKNGDPLSFDVPDLLQPYLEAYLTRVRPVFLAKADQDVDALWLGFEGAPLTYHSIYCRMVLVTQKWFGRGINPHLFRDCAATTMSNVSAADALASTALLGQRDYTTTERYYIRANQLDASRRVIASLANITKKLQR